MLWVLIARRNKHVLLVTKRSVRPCLPERHEMRPTERKFRTRASEGRRVS